MSAFVPDIRDPHVRFGRGAAATAADALVARGAQRVLLVSTGSRRAGADALSAGLGDRSAGVFAQAEPQVPAELAERAVAHARQTKADWVVAHGGGTPIGLAKAIALSCDVAVGAIPTTYAGSEMTDIYGITRSGVKTTGRDPRVRPSLVIYDPELVDGLPPAVAVPSVLNALAHAVEALYAAGAPQWVPEAAEEAAAALFGALPGLGDPAGRDRALYGAYLAGKVLGAASMGLHHKLAHVLGGSFGVPHAAAHAVLLPHVIAANGPYAPQALAALRRAFDTADPAAALWSAADAAGAPTCLTAYGFAPTDVPRAVALAMQQRYANPRALAEPWLTDLLDAATHGLEPRPSTPSPH